MQQNDLVVQKRLLDEVSSTVQSYQANGQLNLPANYSATNALRAAWLIMQDLEDRNGQKALDVCTRASVKTALLQMVVQGLNPMKKQCYFQVYKNKLECTRSYFGSIALVKRICGATNVWANVVYEGDKFKYRFAKGKFEIVDHTQDITNVKPDAIQAAYCVVTFPDAAKNHVEIMTIDQIRKAWEASRTNPAKGETVHMKYPDQMAKRTVINRACKILINTSSDDDLLLDAFGTSDMESLPGAETEIPPFEEPNSQDLEFPNSATDPETEPESDSGAESEGEGIEF